MDCLDQFTCDLETQACFIEPTEIEGIVAICGKTYPFREWFKALGLHYDNRQWLIDTQDIPAPILEAVQCALGRDTVL